MKSVFLSVFGAALFAITGSTGVGQIWTFSTGAQGWSINDVTGTGDYVTSQGTYTADWHPSGGNPGGFISHIDPSNFTFMFSAPSDQLGNYSIFLGGKLQFSLQTDLSADYSTDSVIVFRGGASGLTLVSAIAPQPNATWTDYSIALVPGLFRYDNLSGAIASAADFSTVLGDLTGFMIDAEYHSGVAETTGLDSVAFTTTAIPEPASYSVIAATALLVGVAWSRRRAR